MWPILYNWFVYPLFWLLAKMIALTNRKIDESLKGKKGAWKRLDANLTSRDFTKKLIWFHAPSAGEFIQVQPLLEKFLDHDYDCIVTFNSVSAEKWIKKTRIIANKQPLFMDYLPMDSAKAVKNWLLKTNPSALVFVKYDLWPNLIWQTEKLGIPIYLTSATIHEKTKRYTSRIGRSFYRDLYSRFKAIYVVTKEDYKRFIKTNPTINQIEIYGDTRFDATINQRDRRPAPELPGSVLNSRVFIAGSTWPPDEDCIFPALKKALEIHPDLTLIIAPHEPTEAHLKNSETWFSDYSTIRLSQLKATSSKEYRVLLVDTIGVLSSLYHVGNLAYIGGGFTTGVHNVMEPCSTGLPVFYGPIHYNSGEALQLAEDGLAFPVTNKDDFESAIIDLLENPSVVENLGRKSKLFIESQGGATERCFNSIAKDMKELH